MKKKWLILILVVFLGGVAAQVRLSLDSPAEFPVDI